MGISIPVGQKVARPIEIKRSILALRRSTYLRTLRGPLSEPERPRMLSCTRHLWVVCTHACMYSIIRMKIGGSTQCYMRWTAMLPASSQVPPFSPVGTLGVPSSSNFFPTPQHQAVILTNSSLQPGCCYILTLPPQQQQQ